MKTFTTFLVIVLALSSCSSTKKLTYNKHPVIKAKSTWSAYKFGNEWYEGRWSIAPHVQHDTLPLVCYGAKTSFVFKTDMDSIAFDLKPNTFKDFYVQMDDHTYAHTIIHGTPFPSNPLAFADSRNVALNTKFQTEKSDYLEALKQAYPLTFEEGPTSDADIILQVLHWTHSQWKHNGINSPSKNDAITILNEAKQGQRFPCFAYAVVLRDQLSALGYKARTVYLKTEDAAHRKSSPGHVATEVYSEQLKKWIFVDGQFNVMPMLKGKPLNAVEFQDAIGNHYDQFSLQSLSHEPVSKKYYVDFVYEYLYYLDTSLDNRYEWEEAHLVDNKRSMMLVPEGAENLTYVDFWNLHVNYCVYTHSLEDFYAKPN